MSSRLRTVSQWGCPWSLVVGRLRASWREICRRSSAIGSSGEAGELFIEINLWETGWESSLWAWGDKIFLSIGPLPPFSKIFGITTLPVISPQNTDVKGLRY